MRIAIVHHHLRPGGVTRVIENAVSSLEMLGHEVIVLVGEPRPGQSPIADRVMTIDGLGYRESAAGVSAEALCERLKTVAGQVDCWHFHNHSLGKNIGLPDAIALLAAEGKKILLQIHDFAEDGRPGNYAIANQSADLYPVGEGVHYAVLTGRDRSILTYAGVPEERLHLLPNPVAVAETGAIDGGDKVEPAGKLLFYPTRGIRRKNIGEAVFLSALLQGEGVKIATSRAPDNAIWQTIHHRWEHFSKKRDLPIRLGVVDCPQHGGHSFSAWLQAAHGILTTSIAEGFGLAFLEPLLLGKSVVGRDLPEVTNDFRNAGLKLPGLYRSLLVPRDWVNLIELRDRLSELLPRHFAAYGVTPPDGVVERAMEAMVPREGWIDFGCLEEAFQEKVVETVIDDPGRIREVRVLGDDRDIAAAVPWLRKRIDMDGPASARTRAILEKHYSVPSNGDRLAACYQRLSTVSGNFPEIDRALILNVFLAPERFHFLKTQP